MTAIPRPKDWVMGIHAYVPGKASTDDGRKVAKLSSNENPLGQSAAARAAFAERATGLDRYPDAAATALREAIAAPLGLDPTRVIQGAGSDEVLNMAVGAYAGPGDEVIHVRYGFAMYEIATRRVGATPVIVPDRDYGTDVDAILAAVTERTVLVFVANPNNPTGTYIGRDEIARLHAGLRSDIMLVIDQAYAEYLTTNEDDGGLELAKTEGNVIVTRTFSKIYGLAGERIGWGYGPAAAIDAMHRIRGPFNVTSAGQAAAIAAVADAGFVERSRTHNERWLGWMTTEVEALGNAGLRAVPSRGNFLLILFDGPLSAEQAYKGLMEAGYITRWLPGLGLGHGLRISIGTEEEVRGVVAALRALIDAAG